MTQLRKEGVTELREEDGRLKPMVEVCLQQVLDIVKDWDSGMEDLRTMEIVAKVLADILGGNIPTAAVRLGLALSPAEDAAVVFEPPLTGESEGRVAKMLGNLDPALAGLIPGAGTKVTRAPPWTSSASVGDSKSRRVRSPSRVKKEDAVQTDPQGSLQRNEGKEATPRPEELCRGVESVATGPTRSTREAPGDGLGVPGTAAVENLAHPRLGVAAVPGVPLEPTPPSMSSEVGLSTVNQEQKEATGESGAGS